MLIRGLQNLSAAKHPSVVSIGNYDGVHLGHQHVIKTLLAKSTEFNLPATVITFEPLAKEFFSPNSVSRLTSIEQRANLLLELGVDQVIGIDFTEEFASYSPLGFIDDVLCNGLRVKYLCVGDDFRFGKDRAGDFELLQRIGEQRDFTVASHATYEIDGERVSSGRVRQALNSNDFVLAETLLGRAYSIRGQVSLGQQLGRTIDFPTANIELGNYNLVVNGVFAVSCDIEGGGIHLPGVANIGKRPTVDGKQNRLEVHLFDFDEDIYGKTIDVRLVKKIREEKKFDSVDALRDQIEKDARSAQDYLHKV
ncbi:MAG: bifunctional riboflavin kinase/FAD synthetase [Acidiferrobacterales bacterium]|nr:bifunctional riboflavin kinase/FAD synthetase [Acidiferrobacterales bacterium]